MSHDQFNHAEFLVKLWYRLPPGKRKEAREGEQRWFWDVRSFRPEVLGFDELEPVEWVQCMGKWMVGYPSPDGHSIRLEDGSAHMVASTKPGRGEPWWDMDVIAKHGWVYDGDD